MLPRIQARNFLSGHRTFRILMLFWSHKSFQQPFQNRTVSPFRYKRHPDLPSDESSGDGVGGMKAHPKQG